MFWLAPLVLRNIIESSHAKMFISRYFFTLKQAGLPCKLSKRNFKPGFVYRKAGKIG